MWAFVFPGQGSQQQGMGQGLYENFKSVQLIFEEASDAIGIDMKRLCFQAPEPELALTENTQPALLTVSYSALTVLREISDIQASFYAGHSAGEYAALVASGALSFRDGIKSVRVRGQAMQSALPVGLGKMAAVMGLTELEILEVCEFINEQTLKIQPANYNCPGQIVVSGLASGINELKTVNFESILGTKKKVKLIELNVSAPFHCFLMKPAEEKMSSHFAEIKFSDAGIPIVKNIDALPETKAANLKNGLVQQITGSVRWQQSVQKMTECGVKGFIELGHGKVLQGLIKKTNETVITLGLQGQDSIAQFESTLPSL